MAPAGAASSSSECRLPRFSQPRSAGRSRCRRTARKPDGRKIGIFVGVLPANTLSPKPDPLFILAGGPGQAASDARAVRGAAERGAPHARHRADRPARHRPLVAAGRARRSSRDRARCLRHRSAAARDGLRGGAAGPRASMPRNTRRRRGSPTSKPCARRWATRAWNLWGGSYGTRVGAGISAAPSASACAAWCSTASRRPAMKITLDVWRDARSRARRHHRSVPAHPPRARRRIPTRRRRSRQIERDAGPDGTRRRRRRPAHRRARCECAMTFDLVLGRAAAADLRARAVEPAARDARAAATRRLSRR